MATTRKTIEEINKELTAKGQPALDERNKVITDAAQKNIDLINKNSDAAKQIVTDNYNSGVDNVNQNAADQRRVQQAQRIANERNISERMANLGLTDSGLNRSQQTGIQLSYANNVSKINQNQQKAIDTLAAAMRSSLANIDLERTSKVTEVETNRDNTIAQNNLAFKDYVSQQATDIYNAETEAITKQNAAYNDMMEVIANPNTDINQKYAAINTYGSSWELSDEERKKLEDSVVSIVASKTKQEKEADLTNLNNILYDYDMPITEKVGSVYNFARKYGLSDAELKEYLQVAEIVENQRLNDKAASDFAKEAEKEVSSLESFIYSSGNSDKAKYAKIASAYNKGYISSGQKASYDSLVSTVSTEGEGNNSFDETYTKISELGDSDLNYSAKTVYDFAYENDLDMNDPKYKILLDKSGLTQDDMDRYIISGSIYSDGSEYTDANASGVPTGRVVWDYNTDGALNYNFEITDATWNWGGLFNAFKTVDGNDKVTIKYPDGTLVAEDVRIDQLPKSIQQTITDATAGKKKGDTFTARVNLKGLRLN